MPRPVPAEEFAEIERVVAARPRVQAGEISDALGNRISRRTLQHRLKRLVDDGRLIKEGGNRAARYSVRGPASRQPSAESISVDLSPEGEMIRAQVRQPLAARTPVGYRRDFLDAYRPGVTFYLPAPARTHLAEVGARHMRGTAPAGTYARQILTRLLIDLSWNSSRLEGNTYSLLDTKRLIEFGQEAAGGNRLDAQMILNHKDGVEFLVDNADDIAFNRYTILNLHGILANNLLTDERSAGRLRHIGVGIDGSVYHPPETPPFIEECFDQLLATAAAIEDPFEQALFVMVQLPYLQPFDDVNKRVSRMAANIPFIKTNLSPLSFTDVPRDLYTQAILGVYELNDVALLRDVFVWSYERSAARYAAVRQSLGEPDPFRLRYRDALRAVVGEVVRERMDRRTAVAHVAAWAAAHVDAGDVDRFRDVAENELLSLHEGNFARYALRPMEFSAWQEIWSVK